MTKNLAICWNIRTVIIFNLKEDNEQLKYLALPFRMVIMRSVRTISRKDLTQDILGYFLAGFIEGEGSFNISLRRKFDYKVKWQVVMSFNVSQKDSAILNLVKQQLDCGIIKVRKFDGLYSFDVTNLQDIILKVIPYFQKYGVFSASKYHNFKIFCEVAYLMGAGKHKTFTGLRKILKLREQINIGKGRTRKYGILDVFPEKESSETIR